MRNRDKGSWICVSAAIFALLLQLLYYLEGWAYTHPQVFFLAIAIIGGSTLICIFAYPSRKHLVSFMVLSVAVFTNLTYFYYSQGFPYIPPLDAIYHWKIAETITDSSRIITVNSTHIEFEYSTYPGFHLFLSSISMVTGIDSVLLTRMTPLVYSLLPFLVYLITKRIFVSESIAWISSYVTVFLPKWYAFPSYSRFTMIYFLMLFYMLIGLTGTGKKKHFVGALVSIFALSITHHVTTYIGLIFIVFLLFFSRLAKRFSRVPLPIFRNVENSSISGRSLLCLFICGLIFPVYSSETSFRYHLLSFLKYISPEYNPEDFSRGIMGFYTQAEQVFVLTTIILMGLVGLLGFLYYIRRNQWIVTAVAFTLFFGIIFAFSLPYMDVNPTVFHYVSYRMVFLVFIALAPFIGYALARSFSARGRQRARNLVAILLLLCLTVSTVELIPRGYFFFRQEERTGYLWEVRSNSYSLYTGLVWFKDYATASNSKAIGDVPLVSIGHGMLDLDMQHYWPLYEEPQNGSEHLAQLKNMNISYFFINRLMTIYREQPNYKRFLGPIPPSNFVKIAENIMADRVFDDNTICLMRIYVNRVYS